MLKHKNTIMLTLYTTILITFFSILSFFLIASEMTLEIKAIQYSKIIILILSCSMISFLISSIIVDRILNPVRIMSQKVKAIGDGNLEEKLELDSNEEELKEYVEIFNEMRSKLDHYIKKQNQFTSDASHELKTPITAINGHIDMLLRWGIEDKDFLENELSIIKKEILSMNELIESLLFFARSDSDNINYQMEYTNIADLIYNAINEFEILYKDFTIEKNIADNCYISCDQAAIVRVFRILLSNAVKYSGQSKKINFELYNEGENIKVIIKDYGIGISNEHIQNIFDRFYRIDSSRTKNTGGTGLGLAIAKDIISSHHGLIYAESDRATSLIIILPIFI